MKYTQKACFRLQLIAMSLWWVIAPATAQAQGMVTPQPWQGTCVASDDVATIQGLRCLIANVLSVAVTGIGLAGFVMLIVGAFRYLTSGGNSKGAETAKNTITYSVIGLVVALSSYVILNLIAKFTGVEAILKFNIPDAGTTITP